VAEKGGLRAFAGTLADGKVASIPDLPAIISEPESSTPAGVHLGRLECCVCAGLQPLA
jgi:hypothetical protein